MSNATQHSRNSGDSRRRRTRGGNNNRNNQGTRRSGGRENRGSREDHSSDRAEEFRPQGPRPPRGPAPVKLSWWQKLLKAIGLYKPPTAPARPARKPDNPNSPNTETRPAKSNTRNARSNEGAPADISDGRPPKRDRGGEQRTRGGDRSTVESPRVYVGNLSYDVSEQDLQELFKGVGPVRNVEIVYNRTTHRSKGYGFVEMLHMDEAMRAVEVLHDQPFMGRKLTVSGAKSKGHDEREDRPEREPRPVVVSPIPTPVIAAAAENPPASAQTDIPASEPAVEATAAAVEDEPTIETIVETVTSLEVEDVAAEPRQGEAKGEAVTH